MSTTATLSTAIDAKVKKSLSNYCKVRGMKIRFFIETAVLDKLEDDIDLQDYLERRTEPTVPLKKVLAARKGR